MHRGSTGTIVALALVLPSISIAGAATGGANASDDACAGRFDGDPCDDGARPGGVLTCGVVVPDEVGVAKPIRRGRLKLATANLDAVVAALSSGADPPRVREHRAWVKLDRRRNRLRGLQVERVHIPESPLDRTTSIRFRGTPTADGTLADTNVPTGRCTQRLVDCRRDKLQE